MHAGLGLAEPPVASTSGQSLHSAQSLHSFGCQGENSLSLSLPSLESLPTPLFENGVEEDASVDGSAASLPAAVYLPSLPAGAATAQDGDAMGKRGDAAETAAQVQEMIDREDTALSSFSFSSSSLSSVDRSPAGAPASSYGGGLGLTTSATAPAEMALASLASNMYFTSFTDGDKSTQSAPLPPLAPLAPLGSMRGLASSMSVPALMIQPSTPTSPYAAAEEDEGESEASVYSERSSFEAGTSAGSAVAGEEVEQEEFAKSAPVDDFKPSMSASVSSSALSHLSSLDGAAESVSVDEGKHKRHVTLHTSLPRSERPAAESGRGEEGLALALALDVDVPPLSAVAE